MNPTVSGNELRLASNVPPAQKNAPIISDTVPGTLIARMSLRTSAASFKPGESFGLSHEFLAIMLGAQRPTVTLVAGSLQKSGLIRYKHGQVTVLDRKGLEAASCECYGTIRGHFQRLRL